MLQWHFPKATLYPSTCPFKRVPCESTKIRRVDSIVDKHNLRPSTRVYLAIIAITFLTLLLKTDALEVLQWQALTIKVPAILGTQSW